MPGHTSISAPILVVDDDPTTRMSLKAMLGAEGYSVTTAESAEAAIEHLQTSRFRIVVSDWEMPGMSGPELCKRVRSMEAHGYVYFILLTSHTGQDRIIEGLESGADEFLTKPYNPAEMRVRIKTAERITTLDTMDMTIFALARLAESRDPETGEHLERVRLYTQLLARSLQSSDHAGGVDDEFVQLMYATSPLHDIGKVAIPDCVLLKPGHLSDREFEIMKSHTVRGAETIMAALERFPHQRFLVLAYQITRSHHERFNGEGYPDGLAGEEIPLAARIMSIADVYDALTSKRVYKDAFAHDVAVSIIREGAGTQFDPRLVAVFELLQDQFAQIRVRYDDPVSVAA